MSESPKYVHKKLNVPLFIVLLICAFVPGVVYGIYCAIPSKVPTEQPKSSGWKLSLIFLALHVIIGIIYVIMAPWLVTILLLVFAVLIFLMGLFNKDGKSPFLSVMCLWVQIIPLVLEVLQIAFLSILGVAGCILGIVAFIGSIVANKKMTAWENYRRFGNKETETAD